MIAELLNVIISTLWFQWLLIGIIRDCLIIIIQAARLLLIVQGPSQKRDIVSAIYRNLVLAYKQRDGERLEDNLWQTKRKGTLYEEKGENNMLTTSLFVK